MRIDQMMEEFMLKKLKGKKYGCVDEKKYLIEFLMYMTKYSLKERIDILLDYDNYIKEFGEEMNEEGYILNSETHELIKEENIKDNQKEKKNKKVCVA